MQRAGIIGTGSLLILGEYLVSVAIGVGADVYAERRTCSPLD